MSLFRKNALDALNSPEQLDQPLQLLRPSYWLILVSLSGFSLTILIWSILGRVPVRIGGKGVLIHKESLQLIQSEVPGRVKILTANVGDCIEENKSLAHIDSVKNELEQQKIKERLFVLLDKDKKLDGIAIKRRKELKQILNRWEEGWNLGAVSQVDWLEKKQSYTQLLYEQAQRDSERQQQIINLSTEVKALNQEKKLTAIIKAPHSGCITDRYVQIGELVQPGQTLFELNREGITHKHKLESLAFFPAKDGKRLSIGQRVRISPTNTKQSRHGGIEGKITSIKSFPISKDAVINRLGKKESLFKAISSEDQGPLIEVITSLQIDSSTPSGFNWGGNKGPNLEITAGTPTVVRVLVEERRPISYVIPLLRDLTGIY